MLHASCIACGAEAVPDGCCVGLPAPMLQGARPEADRVVRTTCLCASNQRGTRGIGEACVHLLWAGLQSTQFAISSLARSWALCAAAGCGAVTKHQCRGDAIFVAGQTRLPAGFIAHRAVADTREQGPAGSVAVTTAILGIADIRSAVTACVAQSLAAPGRTRRRCAGCCRSDCRVAGLAADCGSGRPGCCCDRCGRTGGPRIVRQSLHIIAASAEECRCK